MTINKVRWLQSDNMYIIVDGKEVEIGGLIKNEITGEWIVAVKTGVTQLSTRFDNFTVACNFAMFTNFDKLYF